MHRIDELIYANGGIFNGNWVNNKRHGQRIYTFVNGTKYRGRWKEDIMDGFEVKSYPNGENMKGNL